MDPANQHRLGLYFQALDTAIAQRNSIQISVLRAQINRILEEENVEEESAKEGDAIPIPDAVPGWVRKLIRDRGLRLPLLEKAFRAQKVVVIPKRHGIGGGLEFRGTF